jgi:hypothetical protein
MARQLSVHRPARTSFFKPVCAAQATTRSSSKGLVGKDRLDVLDQSLAFRERCRQQRPDTEQSRPFGEQGHCVRH